ncbi:MAG: hypothetical protein K2V38_16445 [Gemmataceae bacterium]|nr:hypothetical protein [Gemmataceae bacterium]
MFALTESWNEIYTAEGFGSVASVWCLALIAFRYTLVQLWEARDAAKASESAADAARKAAEKTLAESKDAFERFVAAFASRLLSELQTAFNNRDWKLAHTRANDLAELLATLPKPSGVSAASESITSLREFGQRFAELKKTDALEPKVVEGKWKPLLQLLHRQLDLLRAPFRENTHGSIDADDSAHQVPPDRGRAQEPDGRGPGELDSETIPSGSD